MKKIIISWADSGGWGGSEVFLTALEKELRIVHHVKRLIMPYRMDLVGDWKGFIKFFILLPHYYYLSIKKIYQFKANTIIIPGFTDKIIFSFIANIFKLKVIWIEYASPKPLQKRLLGIPYAIYKLNIRFADVIVVPTNFSKRKIIDDLNIFESKIKVIPIGI